MRTHVSYVLLVDCFRMDTPFDNLFSPGLKFRKFRLTVIRILGFRN